MGVTWRSVRLGRCNRWSGRPLPTASQCAKMVLSDCDLERSDHLGRRHPMEEVIIIAIDLAKNSFQVHGARGDGLVAYRKKLSRGKLLSFLASQPRCVVAMEACAGAHYWAREIMMLGHETRLVPPIYVKPFVKRHKNDVRSCRGIDVPRWPYGVRAQRRPGTTASDRPTTCRTGCHGRWARSADATSWRRHFRSDRVPQLTSPLAPALPYVAACLAVAARPPERRRRS